MSLHTPQQHPMRSSPRMSGGSGRGGSAAGGRPPTGSPSFDPNSLFAFTSPPMQPLSQPTLPTSAAAAAAPASAQSASHEFAHPSSIGQSPMVTSRSAIGLMRSLHRSTNPPTASNTTSNTAAAAASSNNRSRRGSLAPNAFEESKSTPHLGSLRSATTSPTMNSRSFTHALSKPYDASPYLGSSSRRSPRNMSPSPFTSFGSPSPGLTASLQSHSPSISFALPSPSLLGMNTPSLTSTRTSDLNGGLNMGMGAGMGIGTSHIFSNWEGEQIRRSPRLTPGTMSLQASRRSPSFTMFSPPALAQNHPSRGGGGSGSGMKPPSMSPPLPSHVPTSPNLSILGKLRSLHDQSAEPLSLSQSSARSPSPGMKQEDGASMHSSQQYDRGGHTHQHGRGGKRGRGEYNETPSPYNAPSPNPHQQQHHQHHGYGYSSGKTPHYGSGGYGMSIASPAMVGSLPPQLGSSNSVDASPATFSRALNVDVSSPSGHATPRRALQKAAAKQQAATPRNPRTKNLLNINHANVDTSAAAEQEQMEAENEFAAENAVSAGTGSGSSCHQCKSRRLIVDLVYCCNMWKKGKDKKVSAAATSSAQHSCRKKYCGACLTKFYNERAPSKRGPTNSEFVCPACRGICCCAACRRIKARQLGEIDPSALSPASMLAYSYVYCPDVLLSSMGETEEAAPEELEPPSDHDQSATMEDVKPAAPSLQSYYYDASQVYANNIAAAMHGGGKGKGKHGLIKLEQPSAQA